MLRYYILVPRVLRVLKLTFHFGFVFISLITTFSFILGIIGTLFRYSFKDSRLQRPVAWFFIAWFQLLGLPPH